jgi:hypothetical protein
VILKKVNEYHPENKTSSEEMESRYCQEEQVKRAFEALTASRYNF